MSAASTHRKFHRVAALISALPVLVVLVTGLVLQLKKDIAWIQPPTQRGGGSELLLPFPTILEVARGVPEAQVESWEDIERLDVRPSRGVIKVRTASRYEIQIDAATGEVLHVALRRSDWIESLHDGSWFHPLAKHWIFLPAGVLLLSLWFTGAYLWWLPHSVRRRRRRPSVPSDSPASARD